MTREEFIELINNAEVDEKGNLYYIDNSIGIGNRVYFATITTICEDFVTTYCYDGDRDGEAGLYDRHFTPNDDTLDIIVVKDLKKKRK